MNTIQDIIISEIPANSRVLDLGCGDGDLLHHAIQNKQITGYGIDNSFSNIQACIRKGLSVYQGNLNEGLSEFRTQSFDIVILSLTLQEVMDPLYLLNEMLRVGKRCIVTFPNFGYWQIRLQFLLSGNTPKSKTLPYEWYNTPNIRVLTIKDFRSLCEKETIRITAEESIYTHSWMRNLFSNAWSNLLAQQGLFILEKET